MLNKLAKFVKERRKELALSQNELAKKMGVTNITISRIENGYTIGSRTLRKLSSYFNISTRILRNLMLDKKNEDNE